MYTAILGSVRRGCKVCRLLVACQSICDTGGSARVQTQRVFVRNNQRDTAVRLRLERVAQTTPKSPPCRFAAVICARPRSALRKTQQNVQDVGVCIPRRGVSPA